MAELNFRMNGNKSELVLNENGNINLLTDFGNNLTEIPTQYYIDSILSIITSYDQVSKLTVDKILHQDIISIVCSMFDYLLKTNGKNIKMLEMGKFGLWTYYQAKTLKIFSVDNVLFCCDKPIGVASENSSQSSDTFDQLSRVMTGLGVSDQIIHFAGTSAQKINALQNNYFDFISIHEERYGTIMIELVQAIKKIKPGGLLIGYHCDCYFFQLPEDIQNKDFTEDERSDGDYHTGVIFALKVLFDDDYEKPISDSQIWKKTISKELKESILMRFCYPSEKETIKQQIEILHSIESGLNLVDNRNDREKILLDMGIAISACELSATELAYTTGYDRLKKVVINVKDKYVGLMINYKKRNAQELNISIKETRILLKIWVQTLNDFEMWCIYER